MVMFLKWLFVEDKSTVSAGCQHPVIAMALLGARNPARPRCGCSRTDAGRFSSRVRSNMVSNALLILVNKVIVNHSRPHMLS